MFEKHLVLVHKKKLFYCLRFRNEDKYYHAEYQIYVPRGIFNILIIKVHNNSVSPPTPPSYLASLPGSEPVGRRPPTSCRQAPTLKLLRKRKL